MMGKGEVLLVDSLDYLLVDKGPVQVLKAIQDMRDLARMNRAVAILSVDPEMIGAADIRGLEKETLPIRVRGGFHITSQQRMILDAVMGMNLEGTKPDHSRLSEILRISRPTLRKRVRELVAAGLLHEVRSGRLKLLETTSRSY